MGLWVVSLATRDKLTFLLYQTKKAIYSANQYVKVVKKAVRL